ncbi:hypothetical protein B0A55_09808 [Friedmanniomyces simplex]|uniref:Uncharacterized protein n=1 Tax=Friedmanniomyces simplex TaxID=329884 RepID=A0A4U0WN03_9PEZI|nr:hypothetical protein B0A55_09808 [Friedmanniomyces simplex]
MAELEAMAGNATTAERHDDDTKTAEPISTTMARWQHLFNLSPDSAVEAIMAHRQNLTRMRISNEHWEAIRSDQEARGHDRESYEHELALQKKKALLPSVMLAAAEATTVGTVTYLVELRGPLGSAEIVRKVAGMETVPVEVAGRSVEEGRELRLCCVDEKAKRAILQWASERGAGYEPIILVDPRSMR